MNQGAYAEFSRLRSDFSQRVGQWQSAYPGLERAQRSLFTGLGYTYGLETPIVYNEALDKLGPEAEIGVVLVGDNPGVNEQRADRRSYLVGQSGRLAEGFFRRELGMDFRQGVVILNKTPVHSPKTAELRPLFKDFPDLLTESQRYMAGLALAMAAALGAQLWVTGYSELRRGGLFWPYAQELGSLAQGAMGGVEDIFVFRHFSMNQFSGDYARRRQAGEDAWACLRRIGAEYRGSKLGL